MPSKKKKYNARFPAGRIKKIMQTDEEVGKVAQAVPVIISRTLELFVESLLKKSMQITLARNAKTLTPSHMKQCILSESRFDFLKDLVKDIPDASLQEDNENNAMFEDSSKQTDDENDVIVVEPSHSKRKQTETEREAMLGMLLNKVSGRPKRQKKVFSKEVSSTRTSSSSSQNPVPPTTHLPPPNATATVTAANYYKEHQEHPNVNRKPVIQYGPKITHLNNNQQKDVKPVSQLAFSVSNLLNQTPKEEIKEENKEEPMDYTSPPPLAAATSSCISGNISASRLAPSENVPPLVPLRLPPAPTHTIPIQISAPKYVQIAGDLSIDEDYDN